MNDAFFAFESDFVASLRCIPMAVRLRLDVSGVKLKLNEWSKLGLADRRNLATLPCWSPEAARAYRDNLSALVERTCGALPSLLPEPPEPVWENGAEAPDQVLDQARALNLSLDGKAWGSLTTLQRFALVKLSRPGHENRNFLPAMREFGLAPNP
jgi:hypothetical protein